jgi:hypothetical protein
MLIGFSDEIKDRRIDKYLDKKGYNLAECEIFYSPISIYLFYLFYLLLLILSVLPMGFYFLKYIFKYPYYFLIYFIVQYLVLAYLNNSYVITQQKLIVINPNFPFQKMKVYEFGEIDKIKIDNSGLALLISWIFLIFCSNYIEVYSTNKVRRFYSIFLEVDCFDENLTEKTLDDFANTLSKNSISLKFNL